MPTNQRERIDRDAITGTWEYIPTWKIPHIVYGETPFDKEEKEEKEEKKEGMGSVEIDEYGSYQFPNLGGPHDLALIVDNNQMILQITEYVAGISISTL